MQWMMRQHRQHRDTTPAWDGGVPLHPPAGRLQVRFWGVRGSHPSAYSMGSRFGGNTTCLELRYGRHVLIVDAGSGIMALGDALMREWRALPKEKRPSLTLLFTHAHHDHLCGLPFFAPLFEHGMDVHLLGPDLAGLRFEEILSRYICSPYFPVDFHDLPSHRHLRSIGDGTHLVWPEGGVGPTTWERVERPPTSMLTVEVLHTRMHPREGTLMYRVSAGGRSLVFATDVEVGERGEEGVQRFIRFARGADVLVHDAQYSEDDYAGASPHRGYGHSTPSMAAHVAQAAEVGRLVLFHHDPAYADAKIAELERDARQLFPETVAAREGSEILLDADI